MFQAEPLYCLILQYLFKIQAEQAKGVIHVNSILQVDGLILHLHVIIITSYTAFEYCAYLALIIALSNTTYCSHNTAF